MKLPQFIKHNLFMTITLAATLLATLVLTFEPLVSAIVTTQKLPPQTILSISAPGRGNGTDIFADTAAAFAELGLKLPDQALLDSLPIEAASIATATAAKLPYAPSFEVSLAPKEAIAKISSLLARQNPSELQTALPDGTFMTEIVIDPSLVKISQVKEDQKEAWTFTQANPQMVLQKNGLKSLILLGNPQSGDNHGFGELKSCRITASGNAVLALGSQRFALLPATINSLLAYFRHYSCFQSFSTMNKFIRVTSG
jgi:hypothetical protein